MHARSKATHEAGGQCEVVIAYVPILATDACRFEGLAATPDAAKARLMPLFDVTPARGRALGAHLDALADAVAVAFGARPALVDAGDAGSERGDDCARTVDGRVHLAYLLDAARARGLALVPVTGLRRPDAYQLAVADAVAVDRRGVALRLQRPDFRDGGARDVRALDVRALATLDLLGVTAEEVDLVLDFGGVTAGHLAAYERTARAALTTLTRDVTWRSVTIAAATQLGADARGTARGPRAVPRTDWLLWRALTAATLTASMPISGTAGGTSVATAPLLAPYARAGALRFGDYGPLLYGPHPVRPDGAAEWVGYAHGAEWLVRDLGSDGQRADTPRADTPRADTPRADTPRADLPHPAPLRGDGYWAEGRRRPIRVVRETSAAPAEVLPAPCPDVRAGAWTGPNGGPPDVWRGPAERATWRAAAVTHHLTIAVEQLAPTMRGPTPPSARDADVR